MTKKPKKVVPTVTKTTDDTKVVPSEQPKEVTPFDLSKVDPKKVKLAEEMGIPVGQIITWAQTVEARLNAIQENLPQQVQTAMEQAIENARQKQIQQYKETVQTGGGSAPPGAGVMSLLGQLAPLLGGGGADQEMMNLTKEMMKLNMESIRTDISFSKALKNALVSKVAGKAIGEAAKSIIE